MNTASINQASAAQQSISTGQQQQGQKAPSPEYIAGWLDGHRAQAAKLAEAARKATENIFVGSSVEAEFNNLCWTIYHAWKRDGKRV